MKIELQQLWWLLLIVPAFAFVLYVSHKGQFASKLRKKCHTTMRLVLCLILILAMANPILSIQANTTTTIFAIDASDSIQKQDETIQTFLEEAQKAKEKKEHIGLISFGKRAVVEQAPSGDTNITTDRLAEVDKTATNIEGGLQTATSLLPADTGKRVVLLSDGNETTDDALKQAKAMAAQGILVDVYPLGQEEAPEVQLTSLEVAEVINKFTRYELALRLDATIDTDATVRLYRDNHLITEETVEVHTGETRVVFSDMATEGGGITYRAEIEPDTDTISENNRTYAYTYIKDVPRILIVEQDESGREWESLLAAQVETERMEADDVPTSITELSKYDGIILANVSADAWSDGFDTALETYVRTTGGGLLVSGGENAYALGSYQDTLLADILPVEMEIKTDQEDSNLTMVMVIDTSGSMADGNYGITRIDMAKEAAIRSLEHFEEGDRVGVIEFDSYTDWVAKPQNAKANKSQLTKAIGSMQAGGGTSILPALQLAFDGIRTETTAQKHILLLTDGVAEQDGYDSLLAQIQAEGITLSCVGIGGDADTKLLQRLANGGGGRYYFTDEFTDLPEIFAKELSLANREYINNRTFYPSAQDTSTILSDVSETPALHGYVSTTAKSRADQVLVSDLNEPILATWQYGLGRVAAWTADAHGQWTSDWLMSDTGVSILRNGVSWIMKTQNTEDVSLSAEAGENETILHLETPVDTQAKEITVMVADEEHETYEISMKQTAPGQYEGTLPTTTEGAYTATVALEKEDGSGFAYTGFFIGYPKEYDITTRQNGNQLLTELAQITGGRVLTSGSEVFQSEASAAVTEKMLQTPLLLLCMLLLLLDIALRRFPVPLMRIEAAVAKHATAKQEKANTPKANTTEKKKTHPSKETKKEKKEKKVDVTKETNAAEKNTQSSTTDRLAAAKKKRQR